jgi:hypothetical protein
VKKFGIFSFLWRFAFAALLVLGTFNPSGYSYTHWVMANFPEFTPEKALAGVSVLIGWAIFINTTLRSLGALGVILGGAFFGCLVWWLIDAGLLSTTSENAIIYIIEVLIAAILAVGMSWSHLRRRWSGQQDVDDIGEDD